MKIEKYVTVTTESTGGWNPTDKEGWKSSLRDMRGSFKKLNEEVLDLPDEFYYFFFNGEGVVLSKVKLMKASSDRPGDNSSVFFFIKYGTEISGNGLAELLRGGKDSQKELLQKEWPYKTVRAGWKSAGGDNFAYKSYNDDADLVCILDSIFHEEYAAYSIVFLLPSSAKILPSVKNINGVKFPDVVLVSAPSISGFDVTVNGTSVVELKVGDPVVICYKAKGFREINKRFKAGDDIPTLQPSDFVPQIKIPFSAFSVFDNNRNRYVVEKVSINPQLDGQFVSEDVSDVCVNVKCSKSSISLGRSILIILFCATLLVGGYCLGHFPTSKDNEINVRNLQYTIYVQRDEWYKGNKNNHDILEPNGLWDAMNTYNYDSIKNIYELYKDSIISEGRLKDVIDCIVSLHSPLKRGSDSSFTTSNKPINIDEWIQKVHDANCPDKSIENYLAASVWRKNKCSDGYEKQNNFKTKEPDGLWNAMNQYNYEQICRIYEDLNSRGYNCGKLKKVYNCLKSNQLNSLTGEYCSSETEGINVDNWIRKVKNNPPASEGTGNKNTSNQNNEAVISGVAND